METGVVLPTCCQKRKHLSYFEEVPRPYKTSFVNMRPPQWKCHSHPWTNKSGIAPLTSLT